MALAVDAAVGHAACAAGYLGLAGFLWRRRGGGGLHDLLLAGCLATAAWAAAVTAAQFGDETLWSGATEALRAGQAAVWILVIGRMLDLVRGGGRRGVAVAGGWAASLLALVTAAAAAVVPQALGLVAHLGLALVGLVLIENLCRQGGAAGLWAVKFPCIAVGGLFVFDFLLYSEALLFRRVDGEWLQARGAVALLGAPLLAIGAGRRPLALPPLALSRRAVAHTATLVGAGAYLLLMSGAGYWLREFGGDWGDVLGSAFAFAALAVLATLLASGRLRALTRVVIGKNFFAYKYDYREEWLRFIAALAADGGAADMRRRVVGAVAGIVDSPGGALWQWDEHAGGHALAAACHIERGRLPAAMDRGVTDFLARRGWVVDLGDCRERPAGYPGLRLPRWLAEDPDAWLLVPLLRQERLYGVLLLRRPPAPAPLNWEDYDLLRTVGRQAASHLSDDEAMRALADIRQLELFNQRFAFVVHDLKSVIGQMSLLLSNATRHRCDPGFQEALIDSVRESVDAMRALLDHINAERRRDAPPPLDLVALAGTAVAERAARGLPVSFEAAAEGLPVAGEPQRLAGILAHLLDNAVEAAGAGGRVMLRVWREDERAMLEVADNGPGMEPEFIRDQLFRPFRSTKSDGFGIGAYQCRETVRALGGRLAVESQPGGGTRMRASFPLAVAGGGRRREVAS